MTGRGSWKRAGAAGLMAVVALLLGGCVYLRLLELKHQIAAFDRNFTVQTDDGVRIVCEHPVLLSDDVRWIGLAPEQTKRVGQAEAWQVRWVKQLPPEVHEQGAFDIMIDLLFAEDKLTRVSIPERYFAVMKKSLLIDLLRSLGGAHVDKDRRSIEAQLASARPDLPEIAKLLGEPTSRATEANHTVLRYRYVPVTTSRLARAAVFDMTLTFDSAHGQMLRWQGHTPVGDVGFNFEQPAEPPH
jgi:hypothetical protein